MRVVFYARTSTDGQTTENQIRELHQVGERLGWNVVDQFIDDGISGSKGRDARPQFDRLLRGVARRQFDLIAVWSVDRLGRSVQDLVGFLNEIHARQVGLYLQQQGVDTTTPAGRALFQMLGVFAEFERALIQERVRAGLVRAKAQGKRLGRPPIDDKVRERILGHLSNGFGIHRTAKAAGCGVGTVQRIKATLTAS